MHASAPAPDPVYVDEHSAYRAIDEFCDRRAVKLRKVLRYLARNQGIPVTHRDIGRAVNVSEATALHGTEYATHCGLLAVENAGVERVDGPAGRRQQWRKAPNSYRFRSGWTRPMSYRQYVNREATLKVQSETTIEPSTLNVQSEPSTLKDVQDKDKEADASPIPTNVGTGDTEYKPNPNPDVDGNPSIEPSTFPIGPDDIANVELMDAAPPGLFYLDGPMRDGKYYVMRTWWQSRKDAEWSERWRAMVGSAS